MVKDLVKLTNVPQYIFQKTGVMVTKYRLKLWVKNGELPLVKPLAEDKRFKYTLKRYVDQVVGRYSE